MMNLRRVLGILVLVWLSVPVSARADAVTDWSSTTVQYVAGGAGVPAGRAGVVGLLDIALVHLAMHDAVQAIEGRFNPYHYSDPSKLGVGSPAAAAAAAAHRMLVLLYGQAATLDPLYEAYVNDHALAGDPGLAVGEAAAAAIYGAHYRAPIAMTPFFGGTRPGEWRSPVPMAFLELAVTKPFALNRPSQFRPPPPPPMKSEIYRREYDEVKAMGDALIHVPPTSQTETARFWSSNIPVQLLVGAREIAAANLPIGDAARLLALVSMALADSAIGVWDAKYFYNFWRPQTAIREGENDGNPQTAGDAAWTSLIASPPYPDYVSGANGLSGAFTGMLRLFLGGDQFNFSLVTFNPLATNPVRHYQSFSELAQEVVDARILLGIHFRAADEEARRLGERVAHWTYMRFLRPVPGSGGQ